MKTLTTEPLTLNSFIGFGEVIEADHDKSFLINEGTTRRFHALATTDVMQNNGEAILSIFRGTPRDMPLLISMMERHPLGSQAFMPMSRNNWLVLVARGVDTPEPQTLRLFSARGDQGVQYGKNIWHHPLLVLGEPQDFLIVDRAGEGENLEEHHYAKPVAVISLD
ncbi:MAG: ureidoglycolate lyase [Cohaesibacteraceae bacterium]|nr:ureidoglycolate lyase [Cohaesibacteraceae bacterium]MBL4875534.1 ureidoglycolate lyase [Cohaesibacteraceae bacterium]